MGFGRGFDQEKLCGDSDGGEGRDEGFLSSEGVGEGVEGVGVDWDDGGEGGKAMSVVLASKDCDFEASVKELVEYGWAEVASSLRESLMSRFWKGTAKGMRR